MGNLTSWADKEIDILMKNSKDDKPCVAEFIPEIKALVKKFEKSGQSGSSAPYYAMAVSEAVKKLCLYEPLSPVMGTDDEWEYMDDKHKINGMQNKRCSALFKNSKGEAYYLDAIIFKDEKKHTWNGSAMLKGGLVLGELVHSRNFIKSFPFIPKTFYIDVISKEVSKDNLVFYVKNEYSLLKVWEYYKQFKKDDIS